MGQGSGKNLAPLTGASPGEGSDEPHVHGAQCTVPIATRPRSFGVMSARKLIIRLPLAVCDPSCSRVYIASMLTPMLVQYLVGLLCLKANPDSIKITLGDPVLDPTIDKNRDVDVTVTARGRPGVRV